MSNVMMNERTYETYDVRPRALVAKRPGGPSDETTTDMVVATPDDEYLIRARGEEFHVEMTRSPLATRFVWDRERRILMAVIQQADYAGPYYENLQDRGKESKALPGATGWQAGIFHSAPWGRSNFLIEVGEGGVRVLWKTFNQMSAELVCEAVELDVLTPEQYLSDLERTPITLELARQLHALRLLRLGRAKRRVWLNKESGERHSLPPIAFRLDLNGNPQDFVEDQMIQAWFAPKVSNLILSTAEHENLFLTVNGRRFVPWWIPGYVLHCFMTFSFFPLTGEGLQERLSYISGEAERVRRRLAEPVQDPQTRLGPLTEVWNVVT